MEMAFWLLVAAMASPSRRNASAANSAVSAMAMGICSETPADARATTPAAVFADDEPLLFDEFDRLKIVFVDGVFSPEQSDELSLEGVTIDRLEDICCKDIHWAKDLYGVLEARGQVPVQRPLAALNTAFASGP